MAGNIQNPKRNFPLAMFLSIILIIANYILPVLLVTSVRHHLRFRGEKL
jgi:amino acid transporter